MPLVPKSYTSQRVLKIGIENRSEEILGGTSAGGIGWPGVKLLLYWKESKSDWANG